MKKWIVSIALMAGGCGTVDNRAGVARLEPAALEGRDVGVVLFSVGAPERCVSQATFVNVHDANTRKTVKAPPIGVDAYVHKSEFTDHHGLVNAITLPAGRYFFVPVIANPFVQSDQAPTLHFEVVAGETTYVGEIFMEKSCALSGRFDIHDRFERDTRIAAEKNPAFAGRAITKRLMSFGEPIVRK